MSHPNPSLDLPRAFRALRALLADPDDLPQVFTVIDALRGEALARIERRFTASAEGRRLLSARPDIVPILGDRAALRALPDGSLGRAYLAFVESEGVTAEGIVAADVEGWNDKGGLTPAQAYVHQRMRDTHDLWHALTGYGGDVLGEAALLAFTLAQTWNTGIAVIVALSLLKALGNAEAQTVILEGFRRGQRSAWLPAQEWEALMARPQREVRAELKIDRLRAYTPVRSNELRTAKAF